MNMEDRLYNSEIKLEYLETFDNEQSRTTIAYLFFKSKEIEEIFEKDLYEFDIEEIKNVLHNTNPLNRMAAKTSGSIILNYISWAINKGLKRSNLNPLADKSVEWYEQFVDKSKKIFITRDELKEIEKDLVNAQDAVIPYLIFEGALGTGASELVNLKQSDIDWENNILYLEDDKYGKRHIVVSEDCMRLIRQAIKETEYRKSNGESQSRNPILSLVENEYVIRSAQTNTEAYNKRADKHLVYRRITTISEFFELPYLTAKNIQKSGMIYMGKELYLRDGKLEKDQYHEIAEKFGVRKQNINGYEYYNTSALKEFINAENIKKLYGIDIEK
jgi:integrase